MPEEFSGDFCDSDDEVSEETDTFDEVVQELSNENVCQVLPNDVAVLYDYDFPMTDSERDEMDVHEYKLLKFHFSKLILHGRRVPGSPGVGEIPSAHILKRWTKDARDVLPPHLAMHQRDNPSMKSTTFRHGLLYLSSLETVKIGNTDTETCKIVMRKMAEARKECAESLAARGVSKIPEKSLYDSSDRETDCFNAAGYQYAPEADERRVFEVEAVSSNGVSVKQLSKLKAPLIV